MDTNQHEAGLGRISDLVISDLQIGGKGNPPRHLGGYVGDPCWTRYIVTTLVNIGDFES
jgi:hypothetical protein